MKPKTAPLGPKILRPSSFRQHPTGFTLQPRQPESPAVTVARELLASTSTYMPSRREQIAARVLAALVGSERELRVDHEAGETVVHIRARFAVEHADSLLAELARREVSHA